MARPKKHNRKYLYVIAGCAVIVLIIAILEVTNTTHFFHSQKPIPIATTGNELTKGEGSTKATTKTVQSGDSTVSSSKQATTVSTPTGSPPPTPWGTFANENTATSNETMESSCNTIPGATCQIIFTNDNSTKSLPAKNADSGGAVYWSWTPASIGLTTGTWHETMKAVLGSQSSTASNNPLTLEVAQ